MDMHHYQIKISMSTLEMHIEVVQLGEIYLRNGFCSSSVYAVWTVSENMSEHHPSDCRQQ